MLNSVVDLSRTWPNTLIRTGIGALAFSPWLLSATSQETPFYLASPTDATFVEVLSSVFIIGLCLTAGTACASAGEAIALRLRPRSRASMVEMAARLDAAPCPMIAEMFVTARFSLQALSGLVVASVAAFAFAAALTASGQAALPMQGQRMSEAIGMASLFLVLGVLGSLAPLGRLHALQCALFGKNQDAGTSESHPPDQGSSSEEQAVKSD